MLLITKKNAKLFKYACNKLKGDKTFILKLIISNSTAFKYVTATIKQDKDIAYLAVQSNGLVLKYLHKNLKNNKKIVLAAVNQNGLALKYAPENLKNNHLIVRTALKNNAAAFEFIDYRLKSLKIYDIEYFDDFLDLKGLIDPLPVLRAKKRLQKLDNGKILKIITTCAASYHDIPELAKMTKNSLLDRSKKDNEYIFRIKKSSKK